MLQRIALKCLVPFLVVSALACGDNHKKPTLVPVSASTPTPTASPAPEPEPTASPSPAPTSPSAPEPQTPQEHAHAIMGDDNFFGLEKNASVFGFVPSDSSLYNDIPYSVETLTAHADDATLILVLPGHSINDLVAAMPSVVSYCDSTVSAMNFMSSTTSVVSGWILVSKAPLAGSFSKVWNEQQTLQASVGSVFTPDPRTMVFALVGDYLTQSEMLYDGVFGRTSSSGQASSKHPYIGTNESGAVICIGGNDVADPQIGLSSAYVADGTL